MKLVKYHRPYNPLESFFDHWNLGLFPALSRSHGVAETDEPALRLPRTNVEEKGDGFVFTMELPGLAKKDVDVSIENDTLIIRGERVEKTENGGDRGFLRREIRSSKFERSFSLGEYADRDNIKAKMADGILTITVPKKEDKVGRRVDVN